MKLKLDQKNRKFVKVELELDGKTMAFNYFEQNGQQKKRLRELLKNDKTLIVFVDELRETVFFENLKGKDEDIKALKEFYDVCGNLNDLMNACDEELGKQKRKD
jgi:hypothetical protein